MLWSCPAFPACLVASDHCLDPLLCVLYMGQNLQGSLFCLACHQDTHWVASDHDSKSTWLCGLCMGQTYTCAQPRGRSQIICMLMLFCPAYRLDNNCTDIDEQMHLSSFSEKTKDVALTALILPSISGLPWWDPANARCYHAPQHSLIPLVIESNVTCQSWLRHSTIILRMRVDFVCWILRW